MAKERMNNLLRFTEYDHLQSIKTPNNITEIRGFSVLENYTVKELIKLAKENSSNSEQELLGMKINELKKLAVGYKEEIEINNPYLYEKASPKQIAARKRFLEMINKKKKKPVDDKCHKCSK